MSWLVHAIVTAGVLSLALYLGIRLVEDFRKDKEA